MPIYEYGCDGCGHRFEIQQKLADTPLKTCPQCHQDQLSKLISPTAFVLKGSGWYKDGYSGSSTPKRTENQVTDRLQKAVDDDKKKGSAAPSSAPAASSSSSSSTPPAASGGDKSGASPAAA